MPQKYLGIKQDWNQPKNDEKCLKEEKINQKRQIWGTPSGSRPAFACQPALGIAENTVFLNIFIDFRPKFIEKRLKRRKKGWKQLKKVFWPAFGCGQHLKAGWNTQQL